MFSNMWKNAKKFLRGHKRQEITCKARRLLESSLPGDSNNPGGPRGRISMVSTLIIGGKSLESEQPPWRIHSGKLVTVKIIPIKTWEGVKWFSEGNV